MKFLILINMKDKRFIILIILLFTQIVSAQKGISFKDGNLKSVLLESGYDFNKSGEIEVSEIDTVTKLNISKRNISRLDDLIYFKNLKELDANTNQIKNLNVFFNNLVIEEIYIGENLLGKKLILKNLKNLKGLYAFRNSIEEIDLYGTDSIEYMYLQENLFEKVEFKNLSKLKSLQLAENKNLKSINVNSNAELVQLYLTDTAILKLDITGNPILKTLYVDKGVELTKGEKKSIFKSR